MNNNTRVSKGINYNNKNANDSLLTAPNTFRLVVLCVLCCCLFFFILAYLLCFFFDPSFIVQWFFCCYLRALAHARFYTLVCNVFSFLLWNRSRSRSHAILARIHTPYFIGIFESFSFCLCVIFFFYFSFQFYLFLALIFFYAHSKSISFIL